MNEQAYLPTIVKYERDQKSPETNLPEDKTVLHKRAYSFVTDLFIIGLINKGLMYTYISFLKTYFYQLTTKTQLLLEDKMYDIHFVSLAVVFWGYFLMSYYWGEGKTPGKHIFGLKVHSPDFKYTGEYHLTLKESFARTLGYFINCLSFGFLFVVSFITKSSKGIPDWLSETMVVTDEQMEYIQNIYFRPDFEMELVKEQETSSEHIQLSLFDHVNELESSGTVIELPAPDEHIDKDDSEAA